MTVSRHVEEPWVFLSNCKSFLGDVDVVSQQTQRSTLSLGQAHSFSCFVCAKDVMKPFVLPNKPPSSCTGWRHTNHILAFARWHPKQAHAVQPYLRSLVPLHELKLGFASCDDGRRGFRCKVSDLKSKRNVFGWDNSVLCLDPLFLMCFERPFRYRNKVQTRFTTTIKIHQNLALRPFRYWDELVAVS